MALSALQAAVLAGIGMQAGSSALIVGMGAAFGFFLRISHQLGTDLLFRSRLRAALLRSYDRIFAGGRSLLTNLPPADLLQRMGADLPSFIEARFYARLEMVSGLAAFGIIFFALAATAPLRLISVLLIGGAAVALAQIARRLLAAWSAERAQLAAEIFRKEKNFVEGMDHLRISGRYSSLRGELERIYQERLGLENRFALVDNLLTSSHWALRYLVMLGFASLLALPAGFDPKSIFWLYLSLGAAAQIGWGWQKLLLSEAHFRRAGEVIDPKADTDHRERSRGGALLAQKLEISFDPRKFERSAALGPFELLWIPGDRVWIEGRSGAGKTTLLRSLAGLHSSWRGRIEVPDSIGFVPQNPFFFEGESIAYNLESSPLDQDLLEALGLKTFFDSLPKGQSTTLGPEGVNPSRGQRIRLAVYRELMRRPSLLLLDEPLAGLDRQSAKALLKACRIWMADGILCVCEHRKDACAWLEPTQSLSLDTSRETEWTSATV